MSRGATRSKNRRVMHATEDGDGKEAVVEDEVGRSRDLCCVRLTNT